jgi:2-C-methyl-D-erythritol 2,4-cyclodiphosphate synthase
MRAGVGFDAHRFTPGRTLVIGGVEIRGELGLDGHSDGDVLCHAIADALLGPAGLGDLGAVFGTDDPEWAGASSLDMLNLVAGMLHGEHYRIANVDAVVIAQRPEIAPYREEMASLIAKALGVDRAVVSVKATSTDSMGFTGRGEGIAAMAVALLESLFGPL